MMANKWMATIQSAVAVALAAWFVHSGQAILAVVTLGMFSLIHAVFLDLWRAMSREQRDLIKEITESLRA